MSADLTQSVLLQLLYIYIKGLMVSVGNCFIGLAGVGWMVGKTEMARTGHTVRMTGVFLGIRADISNRYMGIKLQCSMRTAPGQATKLVLIPNSLRPCGNLYNINDLRNLQTTFTPEMLDQAWLIWEQILLVYRLYLQLCQNFEIVSALV